MKILIRLVIALVVLSVLASGARNLARHPGAPPPGAVGLALVYAALSVLGYVRLRSKPDAPARRPAPRRRALPPAPGGVP